MKSPLLVAALSAWFIALPALAQLGPAGVPGAPGLAETDPSVKAVKSEPVQPAAPPALRSWSKNRRRSAPMSQRRQSRKPSVRRKGDQPIDAARQNRRPRTNAAPPRIAHAASCTPRRASRARTNGATCIASACETYSSRRSNQSAQGRHSDPGRSPALDLFGESQGIGGTGRRQNAGVVALLAEHGFKPPRGFTVEENAPQARRS